MSRMAAAASTRAGIHHRAVSGELLAAKGTQPVRSLNDLRADTFEDEDEDEAEREEFLAFIAGERPCDVA